MKNFRQKLIADSDRLFELALTSDRPVWSPLTTRELAKLLGVSVQVLANWRVRDIGPPSRPAPRGRGHRRHYRLDEVLSWLTGQPSWKFNRAWLVGRGLAPDDADAAYVEWATGVL
ncbi:helix-turn-helix domain-containing protein [Alloyangia pacifica]|uniref:helix-turn-helix domain-containing protein n=1 Tax=Alloyangia pacifica TaxID=311180 RepID=UPI003990DC61